jgi:hypothetical protein
MNKQMSIEKDLHKFKAYLEANGVRVLAATLMVEIKGRTKVCVVGNNEMVSEMAICTIAGMNGLTTVRDV